MGDEGQMTSDFEAAGNNECFDIREWFRFFVYVARRTRRRGMRSINRIRKERGNGVVGNEYQIRGVRSGRSQWSVYTAVI